MCVCVCVGVGWTVEHLPNVLSTPHHNHWHVNITSLSFVFPAGLDRQSNKVTWQFTTSSPRCPAETWPPFFFFHSGKKILPWQRAAVPLRLCDKILDIFSLTSAAGLKAGDLRLLRQREEEEEGSSKPQADTLWHGSQRCSSWKRPYFCVIINNKICRSRTNIAIV